MWYVWGNSLIYLVKPIAFIVIVQTIPVQIGIALNIRAKELMSKTFFKTSKMIVSFINIQGINNLNLRPIKFTKAERSTERQDRSQATVLHYKNPNVKDRISTNPKCLIMRILANANLHKRENWYTEFEFPIINNGSYNIFSQQLETEEYNASQMEEISNTRI